MINAETLIRVDVIMVCLVVLGLMSFGFEKTIYMTEKALTGKWR